MHGWGEEGEDSWQGERRRSFLGLIEGRGWGEGLTLPLVLGKVGDPDLLDHYLYLLPP